MTMLALLALLSSLSSFDYDRLVIHELFAGADAIVLGSISGLQEQTFDLAVEEWFVGGHGQSTLRLKRFVDWTCASRWREYSVGQRVVLFLKGDRTLGAGNEGEWPVLQEGVLVPYRMRGRDPVPRSRAGSLERRWTIASLPEIREAAHGFRGAFVASWETGGAFPLLRPRFAEDEEGARAFARDSSFALQLYQSAISSG